MVRALGICVAAAVSLTVAVDAACAKDPDKKGQIELLSVGNGGQAQSSKPKEIVVIPSKPPSGAKPSAAQPRKLRSGQGAQPAHLPVPAVQNIREPARRSTTQ